MVDDVKNSKLQQALSLVLFVLICGGVVTWAAPLNPFTEQTAKSSKKMRSVQTIYDQENHSDEFRTAIKAPIRVHRPAVAKVTFSAECEHRGGPSVDAYTTVRAKRVVKVPGGPAGCDTCGRKVEVALHPRTRKDLVFCSHGLGSATTFHWTGSLGTGRNLIQIEFASIGGGFARLDDMNLTVEAHLKS